MVTPLLATKGVGRACWVEEELVAVVSGHGREVWGELQRLIWSEVMTR